MNSIPFAGLASAFSEKGLGAFMSLRYSSTQFNFGTASAGAGFAAKSLFTRIVDGLAALREPVEMDRFGGGPVNETPRPLLDRSNCQLRA